ncbi:MAG: site-specific integrase [candidate division Zixibacteria bacterium]|nr:site-specific integrase [candidate division Zixibacteria bacterium]
MPKKPTNLVSRNKMFYFRIQIDGCDKWVSLGPDYRKALDAHKELSFKYSELRQEKYVQKRLDRLLPRKPVESLHVDQLAHRWLHEYVAVRRNEKGQRLARQRYVDFVAPLIGQMKVESVTPADLRKVQASLSARGLSVNSVRHLCADIRCMFLYAKQELRCITDAPIPPNFLPKKSEEAPRRLSDHEVNKLLEAAAGEDSLVIRLALQTGLRWGELKSLRRVHFQRSVSGPHLVLEKTKSKKVRRVFLTDQLAAELELLRCGSVEKPMFPNLPYSPRPIVNRLKKRTGIVWNFHRLRHTFASRWLEAGGSKEALRQALGHCTIQLTEHYGRVSEDYVAREARAVANVVAKAVAGADKCASNPKAAGEGTPCEAEGFEISLPHDAGIAQG